MGVRCALHWRPVFWMKFYSTKTPAACTYLGNVIFKQSRKDNVIENPANINPYQFSIWFCPNMALMERCLSTCRRPPIGWKYISELHTLEGDMFGNIGGQDDCVASWFVAQTGKAHRKSFQNLLLPPVERFGAVCWQGTMVILWKNHVRESWSSRNCNLGLSASFVRGDPDGVFQEYNPTASHVYRPTLALNTLEPTDIPDIPEVWVHRWSDMNFYNCNCICLHGKWGLEAWVNAKRTNGTNGNALGLPAEKIRPNNLWNTILHCAIVVCIRPLCHVMWDTRQLTGVYVH